MEEKILEKLKNRLSNCIYYNKDKLTTKVCQFDNSISLEISFNIPMNDLNHLIIFCKLNKLFIEFCNGKILIGGFEK